MHKLVNSALIYTSSNILVKAIPFLLLPVLTRYLTPSDYGIVATFHVVLGFMIVFVGLNGNGAVMVNFFKLDGQHLKIYIGNVFFVVFVNVILMIGLLCILSVPLSNFIKFPLPWLFVSVLVALGQVIASLVLVLWQAEQRALSYGTFNICNMLANVSLSLFLIIALGLKWQGRLFGITIASFVFALIGIFILCKKRYIILSFHRGYIKDALLFGIPLIPHALGGWIMTGIDRIFINSMVSVTATGIYVVGYQVGMIIGLLATSVNTAWAPFLFEKLKNPSFSTKLKIVKYTYLYCMAIIGFALVLGFMAPIILGILVDESFYGASKYVLWIALGYAFQGIYLVVGNYIFYAKKTYLLSLVTFACALCNLALNYVFIKHNGALGAAQATCLTYFLFCALTWFLSSRVYKMPWSGILAKGRNRIA